MYFVEKPDKKKKKKKKTYSRTPEANNSNTDGSFTMVNSNSFFEALQNSSDSSRKQIFRESFLFYHETVCCVYSLETLHPDNSNEYTHHTITVKKIENNSLNHHCLFPDLAP